MSQSQSKQGRRPRWVCRLFGHRYRDPFFGRRVHFCIPSAEGRLGPPDATPVGVCGCGARWERPSKQGEERA